jgi:hypothetical protein
MSDQCPVPQSHGRLQQAHVLWHQALAAYDEEPAFRANLNSVIEALRNTTFMLQAEKHVIPDFQRWYEGWREQMKADAVLTWLVEARTRVVHQSDLETQSTAHGVVHTNLSLASVEIDLPPLLPTNLACQMMVETLPEPFASDRRNLVLSVERRWTVPELNGRELLDALGHAYGFLSNLIRDAHKQTAADFDVRDLHDRLHATSDGRPECMITTADARTVRLALEDNRWLQPEVVRVPDDPAARTEAAKRYGLRDGTSLPHEPVPRAEAVLELAKRMLVRDKTHVRVMFMRTSKGWQIVEIRAADRAEKYALMRSVAELVRRTRADAIIEVGEAWLRFEPADVNVPPENDPKKEEVLFVSVASADGTLRQYITPFSRTIFGRIKLGETFTLDADSGQPTYYAPILEVWGVPLPPGPPTAG